MLRRVMRWLKAGWPLFAFLTVAAVHMACLGAFAPHGQFVNKLVGAGLQVSGALIVLASINSNLGLFRNHGLLARFSAWLREVPGLLRPSTDVSLEVEFGMGLTGSATLSTSGPKPLSDIARLEAMIVALDAKLTQRVDDIHTRISETREELLALSRANEQTIQKLKIQLEEVTVGGFKQQFFGVLLATYGAFVSVFA
jgi:hypothetical protein